MNLEYAESHLIFDCVVGSRAYGIHNPDSDADRSGVIIPGKEYFYGFKKFEQFQGFKEKDRVAYDIRKAINLILDNNPNMMDLLFIPERCYVKITPYWEEIIKIRDSFISKKCRHTFSGYAFAQLRRLANHRSFIKDPQIHEPKREEFGLKEFSIFPTTDLKAIIQAILTYIPIDQRQDFLNGLDGIYSNYVAPYVTSFIVEEERQLALNILNGGIKSQANSVMQIQPFIKDEFIEEARKELQFYSARTKWNQYQEWIKGRNKSRAELELKFGYDTKHAAHLVRLIRMCKEILIHHKLFVDRTNIDADELKAIRQGAWTYDKVEEYAKNMDNEINELYLKSSLRKTPDFDHVEIVMLNTIEKYLNQKVNT